MTTAIIRRRFWQRLRRPGSGWVQTGRIHVVFQPHRYTRTYLLMDEFASAFPDADRLLVLDIYAASEQPIAGVSGLTLAQKIRCRNGQPAEFAASFAAAVDAVVEQAQPGDVVLTLGAGTVSQLGTADSGEAARARAGGQSLKMHRMRCIQAWKLPATVGDSRTARGSMDNH